MSFLGEEEIFWADLVGYIIDAFFFVDVVLTFFSAYYDNNLNLVVDRRVSLGH